MVLAAVHLGLDAVAAAGPVEVVGPFAEERPLVRVAHELEQLGVVLHLGQGHGGHGLVRPRGPAGARAARRCARRGRRPWCRSGDGPPASSACAKPRARLHLSPKLCTLVPALYHAGEGEPSAGEHARRRIVGGRVRIQVDVVLVQRPDVAAVVGRLAEGDHALVAAVGRVGRQVVGQLHVVAVALPDVLDDRQVVHAVVLQVAQQVLGVALRRCPGDGPRCRA